VFHGEVSVAVSLASSLNIPAIQVVTKIGAETAVTVLQENQFKELKPAYIYGPSIALGTVDVTLEELVRAYRLLWKRSQTEKEAQIIAKILSDNDSRALAFGMNSVLNTPYFTAVKTGTSKDMRDNWCIGFSDRYTVGVWVGNFNGSPMRDVSGVSGAAPLWRAVMDQLHHDQPSKIPSALSSIQLSLSDLKTVPVTRGSLKKIIYPKHLAVFAYDVEIPEARQKILFKADKGESSDQWVLNGKVLSSLKEPYFWSVTRGKYTLELQNKSGEIMDTISYWVK
jgi:penicillin-binding protein 1C